jgi:hypothetical protein
MREREEKKGSIEGVCNPTSILHFTMASACPCVALVWVAPYGPPTVPTRLTPLSEHRYEKRFSGVHL